MSNPLISIIIRTKNESDWIGRCLYAIKKQNYKNIETIVVDNASKDNTVEIVKKNFPNVKILQYKEKKFFPGKAINLGIKKSRGKYIAIVSGHCIPKDNFWISNLIKNFNNKDVAGVYGKQEPLDTSNPHIVRELTYLFGDDKKTQLKDPFFHNANSMIRRDLWKKFNFDQKTLHIEDRLWAQKVLNKKYKIIYEPNASVFHYHGVHHSENKLRVTRIGNILAKVRASKKKKIICIIPILRPVKLKNYFLIEKVLKEISILKKINKIFIICDNKQLKKKVNNKKIIFLNRGKELNKHFLGTDFVIKKVYNKLIKKIYKPTHIIVLEELYPHRPKNFFQNLIKNIDDRYDGLIPISKNRFHNLWRKNEKGDFELIFKSTLPSSIYEFNYFQEIKGLGTVTKASTFEINGREYLKAKFFEVDTEYSFKVDNFTKTLI